MSPGGHDARRGPSTEKSYSSPSSSSFMPGLPDVPEELPGEPLGPRPAPEFPPPLREGEPSRGEDPRSSEPERLPSA
jgi:hypothetical protein